MIASRWEGLPAPRVRALRNPVNASGRPAGWRPACGAAAAPLLVLLASTAAWAVDIVVDGRPASTIVIADDAPPAVRYAAHELQHHVAAASGAALPLITESAAPAAGHLIVLGACRAAEAAGVTTEGLAPNGFRARVRGERLFIVGRDNLAFQGVDARGVSIGRIKHTGTLFGVYTFLKERMGVTWLWPGPLGEIVPQRSTIRVNRWDRMWKPPLRHARLRTHYGPVRTADGWARAKNLERFRLEQTAWMMRHRMGCDVSLEYNHAWGDYWPRYKEEHPQFFSLMPNGERGLDPHYTNYFPMCISEPSFHDHIIARWQERRTAEVPWVNACENDTSGKCICERCRSWDVPAPGDVVSMEKLYEHFRNEGAGWQKWLGSLTDRYCRFYLTLLEKARQIDPDASVIARAYENYAKPPVRAKLNRNIVVSLVPGMMFPWTDAGRAAFRAQWQGWFDAGASLYLRPNYALDGHNFPIFYAHKFGEDFAFAFERGMMATDFDSLTGQYATQGPNLYAMVRMQVDGDTPVAEILEQGWFADDHAETGWLDIGTDGPWEHQPPGRRWKAEHGADYNGIAWYRNRFELDASDARMKVVLHFGAVDEACTAWVNGRRLLERPFPFEGNSNSWSEPFTVDVGDVARFDRPNTVAVRVEDNAGAGGIWRAVFLNLSQSAGGGGGD